MATTMAASAMRTSIPDNGHRKYPYLLHHLATDLPNQICCTDVTYVPMPRGHACLCYLRLRIR